MEQPLYISNKPREAVVYSEFITAKGMLRDVPNNAP